MIRRQSSSLRLEFVTHSGVIEASSRDDDRGDVISGSMTKSINQPAGGFQFTLVPKQTYLSDVKAGDWVKIYLDDGVTVDASAYPYMLGIVDRVSRKRTATAQSGAVSELVTITGRDYGKVLLGLQIAFDPSMNNTATMKTFNKFLYSYVTDADDSELPFNKPGRLIKTLLRLFHDYRNQFIPPDGIVGDNGLVTGGNKIAALDYSSMVAPGEYLVPYSDTPNLSGSLWSIIEQFSNAFMNELWVDTIKGVPTVIFRPHPFSNEDFSALDYVNVYSEAIVDDELSSADQEILNWFQVKADMSIGDVGDIAAAVGVGVLCPRSIYQHGVRRFTPTTALWAPSGTPLVDETSTTEVRGMVQDMSKKLAEWHYRNEDLLSGSMSSYCNAAARPGKRMDYYNQRSGEQLSFYIEAVGQSFSFPGSSSTSYTVTRGVVRDDNGKFPHLKSFDTLKSENIVINVAEFNDALLQLALAGEDTIDADGNDIQAALNAVADKVVK